MVAYVDLIISILTLSLIASLVLFVTFGTFYDFLGKYEHVWNTLQHFFNRSVWINVTAFAVLTIITSIQLWAAVKLIVVTRVAKKNYRLSFLQKKIL